MWAGHTSKERTGDCMLSDLLSEELVLLDVEASDWEDAIRKGAKGLLKDAALFDIYTGTGIAPGKKSVAFNLTLRADDRSLTAEEADADVKSILTALEQECGAILR